MAFLTFQGIAKHFGGVQALSDVSFHVERGSCHALMGENGAGKSTLGKILAGVHTADAGEIRLEGRRVAPSDPHAARRLGLAMVHQELAFCPNLSIAENLCLGDLPSRAGVLRRSALRARAREMLGAIDAPFDVDQPLAELTTGQEQLVQIAAAVGTGARVIVFDEPTSSLSVAESEHLFALLDRLKSRGITVLYVSHRMEEIFRLCDTVTVLRDGRHVATGPVAGMTADALVHQMIGRDVIAHEPRHATQEPGPEVLRVEDLASPGKCDGIGFTLRAGEVLGLAGLVGAGRSEVAHALFGLDPNARGRVTVRGQQLPLGNVQAALRAGIGFLPEDRKRLGLLLSLNCRENTSLAALARVASAGVVRSGAERSLVQSFIERLRVKTASVEAPVVRLSGGNQQKIALAKWLARECPILIVDEPTRGVDVGAKAEIHRLLDELASAGAAILLISSELPELMSLSRRILVLRAGRLVGEVPRSEFSQAGLLRLMAGVERMG
ncbi:MAG: sugar ABC transporter ATP-binding protein [Verrucomicrobiae bacterium]|nr:sugar ABC transporter ATP-binding protein [Verrucomicrobiae bacterium]